MLVRTPLAAVSDTRYPRNVVGDADGSGQWDTGLCGRVVIPDHGTQRCRESPVLGQDRSQHSVADPVMLLLEGRQSWIPFASFLGEKEAVVHWLLFEVHHLSHVVQQAAEEGEVRFPPASPLVPDFL